MAKEPIVNGTKILLREYFDMRFHELEKRLDAVDKSTLDAMDKTFKAIDANLNIILAIQEQFRSAISDLKLSRATLAGKADQKSVDIALVLGGISLLVGVVGFIMKL